MNCLKILLICQLIRNVSWALSEAGYSDKLKEFEAAVHNAKRQLNGIKSTMGLHLDQDTLRDDHKTPEEIFENFRNEADMKQDEFTQNTGTNNFNDMHSSSRDDMEDSWFRNMRDRAGANTLDIAGRKSVNEILSKVNALDDELKSLKLMRERERHQKRLNVALLNKLNMPPKDEGQTNSKNSKLVQQELRDLYVPTKVGFASLKDIINNKNDDENLPLKIALLDPRKRIGPEAVTNLKIDSDIRNRGNGFRVYHPFRVPEKLSPSLGNRVSEANQEKVEFRAKPLLDNAGLYERSGTDLRAYAKGSNKGSESEELDYNRLLYDNSLIKPETINAYTYLSKNHIRFDLATTTERVSIIDDKKEVEEALLPFKYPIGILRENYTDIFPLDVPTNPKKDSTTYGLTNDEQVSNRLVLDQQLSRLYMPLNDQYETDKNNLSHEANYKLSKLEQDASEAKKNFIHKWGKIDTGKRSVIVKRFNPMDEIKLKTSRRLMTKGFGPSLPSYSLTEARKELFIDSLVKKKDQEINGDSKEESEDNERLNSMASNNLYNLRRKRISEEAETNFGSFGDFPKSKKTITVKIQNSRVAKEKSNKTTDKEEGKSSKAEKNDKNKKKAKKTKLLKANTEENKTKEEKEDKKEVESKEKQKEDKAEKQTSKSNAKKPDKVAKLKDEIATHVAKQKVRGKKSIPELGAFKDSFLASQGDEDRPEVLSSNANTVGTFTMSPQQLNYNLQQMDKLINEVVGNDKQYQQLQENDDMKQSLQYNGEINHMKNEDKHIERNENGIDEGRRRRRRKRSVRFEEITDAKVHTNMTPEAKHVKSEEKNTPQNKIPQKHLQKRSLMPEGDDNEPNFPDFDDYELSDDNLSGRRLKRSAQAFKNQPSYHVEQRQKHNPPLNNHKKESLLRNKHETHGRYVSANRKNPKSIHNFDFESAQKSFGHEEFDNLKQKDPKFAKFNDIKFDNMMWDKSFNNPKETQTKPKDNNEQNSKNINTKIKKEIESLNYNAESNNEPINYKNLDDDNFDTKPDYHDFWLSSSNTKRDDALNSNSNLASHTLEPTLNQNYGLDDDNNYKFNENHYNWRQTYNNFQVKGAPSYMSTSWLGPKQRDDSLTLELNNDLSNLTAFSSLSNFLTGRSNASESLSQTTCNYGIKSGVYGSTAVSEVITEATTAASATSAAEEGATETICIPVTHPPTSTAPETTATPCIVTGNGEEPTTNQTTTTTTECVPAKSSEETEGENCGIAESTSEVSSEASTESTTESESTTECVSQSDTPTTESETTESQTTESETTESETTESETTTESTTECSTELMTESSSELIPSTSTESSGLESDDEVKLNITINANVMGSPKNKNFYGNGTINVIPGYSEDRSRRDIFYTPFEELKKRKCHPHKEKQECNDEENGSEDLEDLATGKLSSQVVTSVFSMVKNDPKLKVLWPSLKRQQMCEKPSNQDLYALKNQNNEEQVKNTENLLRKAMDAINNIIDEQVRSRTCVPLRPDLQEFYDMILRTMHEQDNCEKREKRDYEIANIADDFSKDLRSLDPIKIEEKSRIIKKLLRQYEELPIEDQKRVVDIREGLLKDLIFLRQIKENQERRRRELYEKKELGLEMADNDSIKHLSSLYTAQFLKLLKTSDLYREVANEQDTIT